jgi:hypothetical protein
MPDGGGWAELVHWVCFNDDCAYYKEGWDWMWQHYEVKSSYRYRVVNAATGHSSPLPVWSSTALRDRILDRPE